MLLFVLDLDADPARDFATVRREVGAFDPEMLTRPALILLNKADLVTTSAAQAALREINAATGLPALIISAEERVGLEPLVALIAENLRIRDETPAVCPS
jgi:GTP-binding protein